jgi:hypothetical protein
MKIRSSIYAFALAVTASSSACSFAEVVPPDELTQTERGVFSASGRYLVVGVRPEGRADAGGWLVEIKKDTAGDYQSENLVAAHLEGTVDGTFSGTPAGDACFFSGMAVRGELVYAACVADDLRSSLLQIDLVTRRVRAGYFSTCNGEPSGASCEPTLHYPNGMAIDAAGRVYVSDSIAHVTEIAGELIGETVGSHTLTQISVDPLASQGNSLVFRHRPWLDHDILGDGFAPNGVQIEGDVLYYVAGSNINKVRIRADGSAGELRVHYQGPLLGILDDFAIHNGQIVLARVITPALVALAAAPFTGQAKELRSYDVPLSAVPSSVAYQPENPALGRIFPKDALVVTSFFGGGLYVLSRK